MLAAGYIGFREGNFLSLLNSFQQNVSRHRRTYCSGNLEVMVNQIDWDAFNNDVAAVFKRHVDILNPLAPWMDKSGNPEMIEIIPQLVNLWPDARFIFAKRRGIENVISRCKKFPAFAFEYHCNDWARNMKAWLVVREQIGDHGIEIDQQDIIRQPGSVAARLATFLNADAGSRANLLNSLETRRPQESAAGSAETVTSLAETPWTEEQRGVFVRLCGADMQAYNYSMDQGYWS